MSRRSALQVDGAGDRSPAPAYDDASPVDAELEKKWASIRSGLISVLAAVSADADAGPARGGSPPPAAPPDPRAAHCPKRRRTGLEPHAWVAVWSDVHALIEQHDPKRKREMYERVRDFLRDYVQQQREALRRLVHVDDVALLNDYTARWNRSVKFVNSTKRMLHHLHTFWIPKRSNNSAEDPVRPLDHLFMFFWREELLAKLPEIISVVLAIIDDNRSGRCIDGIPVKAVIDTLVVLGAADVSPADREASDERNPPLRAVNANAVDHSASTCDVDIAGHVDGSALDVAVDEGESLQLYLQVFEEEFLKRTASWYVVEAKKMKLGDSVATFMAELADRLKEEIARAHRLLHPASVLRLRKTVEEKLVGGHMEHLQNAAAVMVRDGREEELQMVFKLLESIDGGLVPVRDCLKKHIEHEGVQLLSRRSSSSKRKEDVKKSIGVVDDLIKLHKDRSDMIARCFSGAAPFLLALSDAFRSFMLKPVGVFSMAEIVALYVDDMLRKHATNPLSVGALERRSSGALAPATYGDALGAARYRSRLASNLPGYRAFTLTPNGLSSPGGEQTASADNQESEDAERFSEVEDQMDRVIRLFMYLEDKAMFHDCYRALLAKRLLGCHDNTLEGAFLSRLNMQMGQVYTIKISGMFQDVALSNEEREAFRSYCDSQQEEPEKRTGAHKIGFNVHVLNAMYWPSFVADHLRIPRALLQWEQTFSMHYMRNKQSRNVTWIHSQSTNHVAASLNGREYTLVVSTFQACALLQFNDTERRSLGELSEALNVQPALLARYLQPLVVSKKNPLLSCRGDPLFVPDELKGYGADKSVEEARAAVPVLFPVYVSTSDQNAFQTPDGRGIGATSREHSDPGAVVVVNQGSGALSLSSELVNITASDYATAFATPGDNAENSAVEASSDLDQSADDGVSPLGADVSIAAVEGGERTQNSVESRDVSNSQRLSLVGADMGDSVVADITSCAGLNLDEFALNSNNQNVSGHPEGSRGTASEEKEVAGEDDFMSRAGAISDVEDDVESDQVSPDFARDEVGDVGNKEGQPADSATVSDRESPAADAKDAAWSVYYELMPNFKSRSVRIVYPAVAGRLLRNQAVASREKAAVDHSAVIDAAIVRTMKRHRSLQYGLLVAEILRLYSSSFEVDMRALKQRVEQLIEREFLVRDTSDQNIILYAA